MNKVPVFFFVLLVFIASCNAGNEHEIPLYNQYSFHTDSTEKIAVIDSMAKLPYIQYFNNIEEIQIPLYRIISATDYTIYLGVPFHTGLSNIAAARRSIPNADSVLRLNETKEYYYRQIKKGNLYLTEYMRNLDSVSMICVFGSTVNARVAATTMSEANLSARIKK